MKKALATLGLTATIAATLLAVTAGPANADFHTAPGVPADIQIDPAPAPIPAVPAATAARDLLEGAGLVVPAADDVYYANCAEARKAGAAPIKKGEPGYRPALDRDNDGVACE
ncbi:hypothetical protein JMUB6875_55230 [Nocardia sp. JMUB6875]|uniref:excalibur calcium-binding domain-containing protein n=1 Tax=Nocardia sp. JMUB6875 TaxID=3158170 RepID=UPI0032E7429A